MKHRWSLRKCALAATVVIAIVQSFRLFIADDLPTCESDYAKSGLKMTFEGSEASRRAGRRVEIFLALASCGAKAVLQSHRKTFCQASLLAGPL